MRREVQRLNFVIRDDDLSYFSKPADILEWYGDVFSQNIPVGFSTIPFVKPISDVYPRDIEPKDKEYPISGNAELIEYVKANPLVDILQHGCTHETRGGVFEYKRREGLFEETSRGKEELERAFGSKVSVFVPPHDAISNHGILAVEAAGLNIVRGTGSKNFLPRAKYLANLLIMGSHRAEHIRKSKMPAYPHILDFKYHREAYSNRLRDDNLSDMVSRLEYSHQKGGSFIVTTHLHHFTEKRKDNLMKLIDAAKDMGASFTCPSDLFN